MAKKTKNAPSAKEDSGSEKGSKNRLGALTPVFILGAAFAGNWFLGGAETQAPPTHTTEAPAEAYAAIWSPPPAEHIVELTPIMVSISPSDRLLKISLALETSTSEINPNDPQLRDALTTYLRAVEIEMLTKPEFHIQLKRQLLHRAQHTLGSETVQGLLITDYLLS